MADTNAPPPAFVAFDVASALATYAADFGPADPADQLQRLASALQASAPWTTLAKAGAMVVTTRPTPTIAVMGRFDAAGEHRLLELERTLHNDVGSLRFIDWPQVHYDVAALGEALRRHLGGDVARAQFLAIPRGGLIVLGLLAYELGLSPAQLNHAGDAGGPTVIVDDCALTGLRFREVLADVAAPHVVFAHLYSAPELRHALEADLRIATVIAARNLTDRAPALLGDGYAAWRDRWATRAGDQTSWVGITERLAFPWSEPDATFWNAATERDEASWKLVPPAFCAGNIAHPQPAVHLDAPADSPIRPTATTLWARVGDETLVANRTSGRMYSLQDVAAHMWHALVEYGDLDVAATRLAGVFDAPASRIRSDLDTFADDLTNAGVLETDDLDEPDPS